MFWYVSAPSKLLYESRSLKRVANFVNGSTYLVKKKRFVQSSQRNVNLTMATMQSQQFRVPSQSSSTLFFAPGRQQQVAAHHPKPRQQMQQQRSNSVTSSYFKQHQGTQQLQAKRMKGAYKLFVGLCKNLSGHSFLLPDGNFALVLTFQAQWHACS